MRRNRNYGNGNAHQIQSGPLMTTHLRDLDIELELLKRKRDIIQQEQAMLNRLANKRPYNNYEEPRNSFNHQESTNQPFINANYSDSFGPSSSGNFTRPQGPKRPTTAKHWQSSSNQKRFTPQNKINPWHNSSDFRQNQEFPLQNNSQPQSAFIPNQIRPLMSINPSIGQKLQRNFPTQHKDFRPTKVTKAKNQAPKRHFPIEETRKIAAKTTSTSKKVDPDMILRADKPPSVQLNGRLELALGTLMKQLKADHCSNPAELEVFQTPFIQRILKQTIRARIKNVMLDHVVGHFNDIVARYRMRFPKDTDLELVNIAKDAQSLSSKKAGVVQLIESDDPQEFYRKNMVKVLGSKLDEMFINLEKLYAKPNKNLIDLMDKMPEPKKQVEEKEDKADETKPENKERLTYENLIGECENPEKFHSKLNKVKMYVEFIDQLVEQRLPKVLPKVKDLLLSILYTDSEFISTKTILTSQLKKRLTKTVEKEILEGIDTELSETTMVDPPVCGSDDFSKDSGEEAFAKPETVTSESAISVDTVESADISSTASSTLEQETHNKKADEVPATPKSPATPNETIKTPATPNASVADLHFAKLLSRPSLPPRAVIYEFLNQFKPSSIKKHKTIGNLLVIGFNDKKNYDEFLKVGETTIGNSTIIIKASEQVIKTPVSTPTQMKETPKSANLPESDKSIVGKELNTQINDLLSNIRKRVLDNEPADENVTNAESQSSATDKTNENERSETSPTENVETDEAMDISNTHTNDHTEMKTSKNDDSNKPIDTENTNKNEDIETNIIESIDENKGKDSGNTEENDNNDNENSSDTKEESEENTKQEDNDQVLEVIEEENQNDKPKIGTPEKVKDLKESGRSTPTRSSSRLANITPSTIRTRRASRMANN